MRTIYSPLVSIEWVQKVNTKLSTSLPNHIWITTLSKTRARNHSGCRWAHCSQGLMEPWLAKAHTGDMQLSLPRVISTSLSLGLSHLVPAVLPQACFVITCLSVGLWEEPEAGSNPSEISSSEQFPSSTRPRHSAYKLASGPLAPAHSACFTWDLTTEMRERVPNSCTVFSEDPLYQTP